MRSKLFVPGSRPELFEKALRSDADAISFDLEDAVVAEAKPRARQAVAAALAHPAGKTLIVRINPADSAEFDADLDAVVQPGLDAVNLPKVEDPEVVREVAGRLAKLQQQRGLSRPIGLLVNIETPRGLRRAGDIATADPGISGLQLGFGDLFAPLGIERSPAAMAPIWLAVRLAAAEAGVPAYDGAYVGIADLDGFRAEAEASRRFGFAGKSCVHPSQIAAANSVYAPTEAEVAAARRAVEAADRMEASGVGAFTLDGVMYDGPFVARAREIVRLAQSGNKHG